MKKGITCRPDYDRTGRWCLIVEKKKGRLTLDEIKEAAREWEWDFYLLLLDCFHDTEDDGLNEPPQGDLVILYSAGSLREF